ncbi:MAG: hypothetical protein LBF19_06210, partial [Prevotellaceae bacterium]|nr:hypothetical protein [Prevotellaceae bacterium]
KTRENIFNSCRRVITKINNKESIIRFDSGATLDIGKMIRRTELFDLIMHDTKHMYTESVVEKYVREFLKSSVRLPGHTC